MKQIFDTSKENLEDVHLKHLCELNSVLHVVC